MSANAIDFCTPTPREFYPDPSLKRLSHHWLLSSLYPLSSARRDLIRRVDTEWLLFVDDDITWNAGHLEKLRSMIRPDVGAIESNMMVPGIDESPIRRTNRITRGWTGFTLVRRVAVEGWDPPAIDRFEDEHLRRFVLRKGYRWIRSLDCVVAHNISERSSKVLEQNHRKDGYGAWFALPWTERILMYAKTPLFARHGAKRLRDHIYFLSGMTEAAIDSL